MPFYRLHWLEDIDNLLAQDVSRASQRMRREPGKKLGTWSLAPGEYTSNLCCRARSRLQNQSAQTVWIACQFYRSCRKAMLWYEAPAPNSASLPIIAQRASCFVRPCSVNVRVDYSCFARGPLDVSYNRPRSSQSVFLVWRLDDL